MKTTCHGLLSSLHHHGLLSSLHLPWPSELPAPTWPPELPASPWPPSSVPLWRSPSCGPVRVCPEVPPERPPPLPGGTVTAWDTPSGRGELCQSRYLCFTCVFIVLYVQFDFVWSTRYSRCFLSVSLVLSCLVLIKDYYLSLRPRLRVPASSSCVHRDSSVYNCKTTIPCKHNNNNNNNNNNNTNNIIPD